MSGYVLDASVAAKWVLPPEKEQLVDQALSVRAGFEQGAVDLAVPDLFWPELGNLLWKAVRFGRLTRKQADQALQSIAGLRMPTAPCLDLLGEAFSIAVAYRRTFYDSVYVALAVLSGRTLLTADERLANALAANFPVRWLGAVDGLPELPAP